MQEIDWNDREQVLEEVSKYRNGEALKYASEELRGDKEFVLKATRLTEHSLC